MKEFFAELKRRNVYKVAIAYAVVSWLLIQAGSILFPTFEAPGWVMKVFVTIIAAGFPIALVIAWAFEMTPEGMKRTENVPPNEFNPQWSRRKFAALIISVVLLAGGLLIFQLWRIESLSTLASYDPENAYFTEGVQDEILTRLAKVAELKVISRTSTQGFKSSPDDLPRIARQLGVAHILEGSGQKIGRSGAGQRALLPQKTAFVIWPQRLRALCDLEKCNIGTFQTLSGWGKSCCETAPA